MMGCAEEKVKNLRAIVESSIIYENRNKGEERDIRQENNAYKPDTAKKEKW